MKVFLSKALENLNLKIHCGVETMKFRAKTNFRCVAYFMLYAETHGDTKEYKKKD